MTEAAQINNVAYKKGNWMRYLLWGLAAICIGLLIYTFTTTMNSTFSASIPSGYRFAVSDQYAEGSSLRTTYYIYDDKVLVENENYTEDSANRSVFIYDNVDTSSLSYDANETAEICELGTCRTYTKVLSSVKKLLSGKASREYIGL